MNKSHIRQLILEQLHEELNAAQAAVRSAHEAATHEDSIAENKYDTFGVEAAYLAHGQAVRVQEIEQGIAAWRSLPLKEAELDGPAVLGSPVRLESRDGLCRQVFLGPDGAGIKVPVEGRDVVVITPRSPLGQKLIGKFEADEITLAVSGAEQLFEIIEIL